MTRITGFFIGLTAAIQLAISGVEMFLWTKPAVYDRLELGLNDLQAHAVEPIVQNAGLYNAFLAAGLIWGLFDTRNAFATRAFFLCCVIIAGIFGAITLKPTTLVIQSLPAAIALTLAFMSPPDPSSSRESIGMSTRVSARGRSERSFGGRGQSSSFGHEVSRPCTRADRSGKPGRTIATTSCLAGGPGCAARKCYVGMNQTV